MIYAEMCTAADYHDGVVFYCPNPDCSAQMTLCAFGQPEQNSRSPKPYFARKTGPAHVDGCYCACTRYSQYNRLTNDDIDLDVILANAITPSDEKPAVSRRTISKGKGNNEPSIHPIRTLRDLIYFCRFHHTDTLVSEKQGVYVRDILMDERMYTDKKDFIIDGKFIIRGEIFKSHRSYFDETNGFYNGISMRYPSSTHGVFQNYHMCHARITDKKLYDSIMMKLGSMPSSGAMQVAILGEWKTGRPDDKTGCRKYNCTIHSRDQIIVIRDPRW